MTNKFHELEEWEKRLKIVQIDFDSRNAMLTEKMNELKKGEKQLVSEKDKLIIERQKLDAIRRRLTEHQKEVAAKISELAEEAANREDLSRKREKG